MTDTVGHRQFHANDVEDAPLTGSESAAENAPHWAPTAPHFVDFSIPVTHVDSWSATSEDVIEASVAELMSKERKLCIILHQAIEACGQGGVAPPVALVESEETFARHWDALAALHPVIAFPFGRGVHRALFGFLIRARKLLTKLIASCVSYPAKLYELYIVASEVSIGYIALQATALALGDRCAAAVAARHLKHTGQLLEMVHALVPYASVRELQTHGFRATTDDLWEVSGVPAPG